MTFGRIIYEAVLKLRQAPTTLSHVKYLLVDEYQDINRAQAELIEYIGRNAGVFVVGDPGRVYINGGVQTNGSFLRLQKDFLMPYRLVSMKIAEALNVLLGMLTSLLIALRERIMNQWTQLGLRKGLLL